MVDQHIAFLRLANETATTDFYVVPLSIRSELVLEMHLPQWLLRCCSRRRRDISATPNYNFNILEIELVGIKHVCYLSMCPFAAKKRTASRCAHNSIHTKEAASSSAGRIRQQDKICNYWYEWRYRPRPFVSSETLLGSWTLEEKELHTEHATIIATTTSNTVINVQLASPKTAL